MLQQVTLSKRAHLLKPINKEMSVSSGVLVVLLEAGVVAMIALAIYLIRKK